MAITTYANLSIDKLKEIGFVNKEDGFVPFVELELDQSIADHARVKITIDLDKTGNSVFSNPMERIALINEKLHIDVMVKDDKNISNPYTFLGLITDVQVELTGGKNGWMYIYGASESIELERGSMLRTHSNKPLKEIVERVIEDKVTVKVINEPEYEAVIPFSMQYYETDFQYLKRLSWMYGEKFLFRGNDLVFGVLKDESGNAKPESSTILKYDEDLIEVKLNSKLISNRFTQYYHNLYEVEYPSVCDISENSTFTETVGLQSNKLNPENVEIGGEKIKEDHMPKIPIATPVYDDDSIDKLTEIRKKMNMNRMFFVTGQTNVYKTTIGKVIEIDFGKEMNVKESLGELRITKVYHFFDQNKRYKNHFEASQKSYDYFPYEDVQIPNAQPILATVINNKDKQKLGRVQLKFDFETDACQHWFKCSTMDGGGNKSIGKERNRGMIFVPEIKDRIYLGFMEGNPDKPFVMGSFFHGTNAANHSNNIRTISDKANNYIEWNSGAGIKIMDRGGNQVHLDGVGNITIQSSETIKLICKSDKEGASDGSSMEMDKDGNIEVKGKYIRLFASEMTSLESFKQLQALSNEDIQVASKAVMVIGNETVTIIGQEEVDIN